MLQGPNRRSTIILGIIEVSIKSTIIIAIPALTIAITSYYSFLASYNNQLNVPISSIFRSRGSFTGCYTFPCYSFPTVNFNWGLWEVKKTKKKKRKEVTVATNRVDWYFIFIGGASISHRVRFGYIRRQPFSILSVLLSFQDWDLHRLNIK